MDNIKEKKIKEPLQEGGKKLRKIFIILFMIVALLGITLGILNWYNLIGVYM